MYTTKSGDTWDVIAKEVYGSEYHADALMAANPEHIDTFRFSAGGRFEDADGGGRANGHAAAVEIRGAV